MNNASICSIFRIVSKTIKGAYEALKLFVLGSFINIFFSIAATATADIYPINLEKQPLISALDKLAEIAHFNWSTLKSEYLEGESAPPLKGYYTARQAVAELLKNTGILYKWLDEGNGVVVTGKTVIEKPPSMKPNVRSPAIEEITVVGSHIRGGNTAAPVFQFDREDIQNSGLATTQKYISSLPQVFGGGAMEGAISPIKGEGAQFNIANANGINLRGMGFDSTLVLINGRRVAPVGFGDVVDISGIPLNTIEHIDVMTDGASAIYGSDAVGGVVNIVLRKYYEGVETQLGYGDVTSGSNESYRFNQTVGKHWSSGNVLFNYSYRQRAKLSTDDRSITQSATAPSDILGKNSQYDAMLSLSQQLSERVDVYADALYSTRESEQNNSIFGGGSGITSNSVKLFTLTGGGGIDLNDSWRMDASVLFSDSSTVSKTIVSLNRSNRITALDTWALDVKADGNAFRIWGGEAKLALGGQFRREIFAFERESVNFSGRDKSARNIAAVFTELFIPLVGENNDLSGLKRLELTLAGRHEEYSDFGGSANPKAGLLWSPVTGLNLRTTYSKSFRAPLLSELNELVTGQASTTLLFPNSQGGLTPALLIDGYNADLQPEKAVNWTIGADITPVAWSDFSLSLTYFHIDFTDRIQTALEGADINSILTGSSFASVVLYNPDMELINYWLSQSKFTQLDGVSPNQVEVLIDNRLGNIAAVRERGVDFSFDYSFSMGMDEFAFQLRGTYLLTLESQATESASFVDILNTPYNPVDLKLRNSIRWKRKGLIATAFFNYVGSYKDTRPGQKKDIGSWVTFDLNIRYDIKQSEHSWWQDTTVSLGINNLFDKEPPFVANELGYNFDATNANALGRRISLDISKRW